MSKIAIILVGHLRSWKSCKEQFMKYFNKYDPDIYALTYDTINYNSEEILSEEEIKESLKDINIVKLTIKKQKEVFEEAKNKYGKFLIEQNRDINTLTWGCQILNLQSYEIIKY
jgi:type IV secretory pathway component VirB8